MEYNIAGIQQVGIGLKHLENAKTFYAQHFGMDLAVFEDEAEAKLMAQYTKGKVESRKAALMMNLRGGGGFELWQFKDRKPQAAANKIKEGQVGITAIHLRTNDLEATYAELVNVNDFQLSELQIDGLGRKFFCLEDKFENHFKLFQDDYQFLKTKTQIGGVMGVTIGISNPEKSLAFYQQALGFSKLLGEKSFGEKKYWWLQQAEVKPSAFGNLLAPIVIELVFDPNQSKTKIFENRCWGDLGFIHLCLDIQNLDVLKSRMNEQGFAFTVDSESDYDMGDAAGRFAYVEDPDGTLIELVETFKVPIMKKWGWFITLNERSKFKNLPKWIFWILSLNRVKT